MAKANAPRVAILGAGPIGVEAALFARRLGLPFVVYERGRVGEHVQRWGHVRLFTPFGMNVTPVGRAALAQGKPGHALPADDALLTGREHLTAYLAPLAELLQPHLQTETQVLKVSRRDLLKSDLPGDPARAKGPFRLLVRDKTRERIDEADVILDCTGVYGQHRWAGAGGIPAIGETQAEQHICYGLDDILGERKNHYANKSTLVIGAGFSAATTVCALADLGRDQSATWGIWIARSLASAPMRRIPNDPLKERERLAARANNIALRTDDNVEYHAGAHLESLEFLGQDKGFRAVARVPSGQKTWEVDRVVANVGYSPDVTLLRELQIHECYATLGPMKTAAAILGQKATDCLKVASTGPESLRNPEPNCYILGAKSHGRSSHFLLRTGFDQIRDAFTLIAGPAAADVAKKG